MNDYERPTARGGLEHGAENVDMEGTTENKSSAELERDIERTRERMSEDIDAISEKLAPRNLAQSAAETVGRGARRTGSRMADFLKENSVPLASIGFGVSWLVAQRRSRREIREVSGDRMARYAYYGPERRISRYPDRRGLGARIGRVASGVRETVSGAASGLAERAGEVAGQVGEVAERAQERAGELGTEAKERLQELGSATREQTRRARYGLERTVDENPLAVAAGAAVVGLALGLLLPRTRREDEVLGPMRDRLGERAGEAVERVKDAAAEAADQVKETVQSEIKERGPEVKEMLQDVGQRVAEQAKESAGRVTEEAKEAIREQSTEGKPQARKARRTEP